MPQSEELTPAQHRSRLLLAGFYLCLVAGAGISWGYPALRNARAATAISRIADLESALHRYYSKHNHYPEGNGSGTRELLNVLAEEDAKGLSFFHVSGDHLSDGQLQNPVDRSKRIYYRCPGNHNPRSFDLWCEDLDGHGDGINNWSR